MKRTPPSPLPRLGADGLVVHDLSDEVLVYDKVTDQAHCLNQTAALVWRACDGKLGPAQIAQKLTLKLGTSVSEDLVLLALAQLQKVHLLKQSEGLRASLTALTRRQMVRTLGIAAGVVIPMISSIVVPRPAQAATCIPPNALCSPIKLCCTSCNPGNSRCI
jgi:hypothetical protein